MLTDIVQLKRFLAIFPRNNTMDSKLGVCLYAASEAVKKYCKRRFETEVITEYPLLRNGAQSLVLEETPVLMYQMTGSYTNGNPQITNLSSTSNLLVGMPALQGLSPNQPPPQSQPFPNGTVIQSIDSATQVTLTQSATGASASNVPFIFGLAVWQDPQGVYGQGVGSDSTGPYGAGTLLVAGLNYGLQIDQPNGTSKSGKLTKLGYGGGMATGIFGSAYGLGWSGGGLVARRTLSGPLPPLWPNYPPGCVKVVYAAGLGFGADPPSATQPAGGLLPANTTIPYDLTIATTAIAAWMFRNADTGLQQIQSESYQGYSSNIQDAVNALAVESELGSQRQILSRYRKLAI